MSESFPCYWVEKNEAGEVTTSIVDRGISDLHRQRFFESYDGPVTRIQVDYSAVNYKDALAATGHPGVVRNLPHIPGIDAVGRAIDSSDAQLNGKAVVVTGYDLGVNHYGGWAEQILVPTERVLTLPEGLSATEAITLGTAGFTAAQCVQALQAHGVTSDSGPVMVTGATGGVGSIAVMLLAKLGYQVTAVSGKKQRFDLLRELGAAEVIDRREFVDATERPLLKGRFSGAIDSVGSRMLETVVRSIKYRGCVAACGLAGGHDFHTTVYPFLLRGLTMCGIDSAMCPMPLRKEIWRLLSSEWKLEGIDRIAVQIPMSELPSAVEKILGGGVTGRTVVSVKTSS